MRFAVVLGVSLSMLCCGGVREDLPSPEVAVVWVCGAVTPDLNDFGGEDDPLGVRIPAAFSLYGVETPDDGRRLLSTLAARGESIVVGVGRPMLSVLADASEQWNTLLWLGYDDPGPTADKLTAWWAPADSLRTELARIATGESRQVTLVGSSVPSSLLRTLHEAGARVRPVDVGVAAPLRGLLGAPGEVVIMVDPASVPEALWDRVYWVCESPFRSAAAARGEVRMDWTGALVAAVRWSLGLSGVPPGPTLGPWLSLRLNST